MPTITSQSPVAPLMSLLFAAAVIRSSSLRAKQIAGDRCPFRLKRTGRGRLAGLAIPVSGIAKVAFDSVQIGMHPGRLPARVVLDGLVRPIPLAFGGPPQPGKGHRK